MIQNCPMFIWHGSSVQNLKILEVNRGETSHELKKRPYMYAGETPTIAAAFTFPWVDQMGINLGTVNGGPLTLTIPKRHLHLLDNKCSLYMVDGSKFKKTEGNYFKGEFYTTEDTKVLLEDPYDSARECMEHMGVVIDIIEE